LSGARAGESGGSTCHKCTSHGGLPKMHITKRTPAKINLCLLVGPREESGLHEIFTIFAPVNVYDDIEFTLEARPGNDRPGQLHVECKAAAGEANLATQALRALERHTGWAFDGRVVIHKGIPVGAGLGGGSSDAAAALVVGAQALAEAGGPVPAQVQVIAMARQLGADVAFFLDPVPSVGRGVGELLEPIDLPELSLVLVFFDRLLSTERVYRTFDTLRPAESQTVFDFRSGQAEKRWRQVTDVNQIARMLANDLEQASFSLIPSLVTDREVLAREGAMAALVSGSGPTLFGVCESPARAEELQGRMAVRGFRAQVATIAPKGDG
jgi:4-diphosphocytidyl-2-C-methyl-D-erythritol kinase